MAFLLCAFASLREIFFPVVSSRFCWQKQGGLTWPALIALCCGTMRGLKARSRPPFRRLIAGVLCALAALAGAPAQALAKVCWSACCHKAPASPAEGCCSGVRAPRPIPPIPSCCRAHQVAAEEPLRVGRNDASPQPLRGASPCSNDEGRSVCCAGQPVPSSAALIAAPAELPSPALTLLALPIESVLRKGFEGIARSRDFLQAPKRSVRTHLANRVLLR